MRVVRAFGRQRSESARFMGENHFMARHELHVWWLARLIELLWEFVLPMASVALLLYGGLQVLDGRLSLGDLMMFLVYLAMLLEPMAVLATSVTQFQNNLSGFDRVLDLLDEPREMADCPGTRPVRKAAVAGRITLEDVGFVYPGTTRRVLRDIDLEVEPGETIALVGRSGAGKTTLCNLVARFYDPTDGRDPARRDATSARSRSRATAGCWASSSRTSSSSTARSPRTSPTATAGPPATASSTPPRPPTPPSSSSACPTATTP